MSTVLAFDCAVRGLSVAVVRDGQCLVVHREEGRDQAARLLPAIAATLQKAAVDKRSLSMIAVTAGPGSFTGVRVGLAAARGLAVALGVPLAAIATTQVLLGQARIQRGRIAAAAIDSHLGDWYCAIDEGERSPILATTNDLRRLLGGRACVIVGPEAGALAPQLPHAAAQSELPDPVVIARLAIAQGVPYWQTRNRAEGLPRPLYLRGVNVTLPDGARRTVD